MAKTAAEKAMDEAKKIVNVWTANPTFNMGETTLVTFQAQLDAVKTSDDDVEAEREVLTGKLNARDANIATLTDLTIRARGGIKSTFGSNSTQYQQAGGTRKVDRKPPKRKPKS